MATDENSYPCTGHLSSNADLARAVSLLKEGYSFGIVKDGRVLAAEKGSGVKPFLMAAVGVEKEIRGASLADKVVGLAVARLALYFGIASVYGRIGSIQPARELASAGVPYVFEKTVPYILNRKQDGRCPIEQMVSETSSPEETYALLMKFFKIK